jgi:cytochrome b pre-mRNA-processing protein 3
MSSHPDVSRRVITPASIGAGERARPKWKVGFALLVLLALAGLFVLWQAPAERRSVTELAPAERAAVFQEALQRYRVLCREEGAPAVRAECAQQAQYLQLFPECDGACRQLTERDVPGPTR